MNLFFDTSVVVAALLGKHPRHEVSFLWLERATTAEHRGFVSTHGLAEVFSVLTSHPVWRISPVDGRGSVNILGRTLESVNLSVEDYDFALSNVASLGISGGGIYDALHAQAALKIKADILLTANPKHFVRLGEEVARIIKVP